MQILRGGGNALQVGQHVRCRGERWRVSALDHGDGCSIVTLIGIEPRNHGAERQLLTPFDRLEPIADRRRLHVVGRARWRRLCRTLIANDGPPAILRTALTARMQLLPYQLEPVMAIVRGQVSRVLIADAVGLGKTIQAGLIVAELRARHAAARTLVLTPAGIREQWIGELQSRFALEASLLDAAAIRARQRRLPIAINPWTTESLVVTSTDFIKRPEILRDVSTVPWDVVVVDEAHGCIPPSDRHAAVAMLCRLAAHVVLLTATPHSGDPRAFESLCGLGARHDELLVFRRTRADVGLPEARRIHQLLVRPTAAEQQLQRTLAAFATAIDRDARGISDRRALVLATLRKRALSSASSLERSLRRRLQALGDDADSEMRTQPTLPFDRDGELDAGDAMPTWHEPVLHDPDEERSWLTRLAGEARAASTRESKLRALARLIRRIREPIVVFTEYRDTLLHVRSAVAPDAVVLHGGLTRDERRAALVAFSRHHVLLATDAAGEGLNLHHHSRVVINLELPWNPMRLEQRIGRVDRLGQQRCVHAFHLMARHSDETTMYERLAARVRLADAAVGTANPLCRQTRPETATSPRSSGHAPTVISTKARHEAARLDAVRTFGVFDRFHEHIFESGPCVARARRLTRTATGDRAVILWLYAWTAWNGQIVASRLAGALWRCRRRYVTLDELETILNTVAPAAGADESGLMEHAAFWDRRRRRLIAIADERRLDTVATQPGLFDQRMMREQQRWQTAADDACREAARRIDACERWRVLDGWAPMVALVLLP